MEENKSFTYHLLGESELTESVEDARYEVYG